MTPDMLKAYAKDMEDTLSKLSKILGAEPNNAEQLLKHAEHVMSLACAQAAHTTQTKLEDARLERARLKRMRSMIQAMPPEGRSPKWIELNEKLLERIEFELAWQKLYFNACF